jgi:hypothetical protein
MVNEKTFNLTITNQITRMGPLANVAVSCRKSEDPSVSLHAPKMRYHKRKAQELSALMSMPVRVAVGVSVLARLEP